MPAPSTMKHIETLCKASLDLEQRMRESGLYAKDGKVASGNAPIHHEGPRVSVGKRMTVGDAAIFQREQEQRATARRQIISDELKARRASEMERGERFKAQVAAFNERHYGKRGA